VTDVETTETSLAVRRTFDAPVERVWAAWTDPAQVEQWWGPDGFRTTVHEMDIRPGGLWRIAMQGPGGIEYGDAIVYDEVVEPERLVYTHGPDEAHDLGSFQETVTFEASQGGGGTDLTSRMRFGSPAERERQEEFGAVDGVTQTLEHLADHLRRRETGATRDGLTDDETEIRR